MPARTAQQFIHLFIHSLLAEGQTLSLNSLLTSISSTSFTSSSSVSLLPFWLSSASLAYLSASAHSFFLLLLLLLLSVTRHRTAQSNRPRLILDKSQVTWLRYLRCLAFIYVPFNLLPT